MLLNIRFILGISLFPLHYHISNRYLAVLKINLYPTTFLSFKISKQKKWHMAIISGILTRWQRYTFIVAQRDKILAKDSSEDRHWLYLGESLGNRVTGWAFHYRENPLCIGWDRSLLQEFSAATPSAVAASVMCENPFFFFFSKDKRADPVSWPDSSTSN